MEIFMENVNSFLKTEPVGRLMKKYSLPCIISLLVAALYNIVDQIFIANADYLGSFGNAANTVVFPITVAALAVSVMIGDGCCRRHCTFGCGNFSVSAYCNIRRKSRKRVLYTVCG